MASEIIRCRHGLLPDTDITLLIAGGPMLNVTGTLNCCPSAQFVPRKSFSLTAPACDHRQQRRRLEEAQKRGTQERWQDPRAGSRLGPRTAPMNTGEKGERHNHVHVDGKHSARPTLQARR